MQKGREGVWGRGVGLLEKDGGRGLVVVGGEGGGYIIWTSAAPPSPLSKMYSF